MRRFSLATVLVATVALSGCDRPPEEDIAAQPPTPPQTTDQSLELATDSGTPLESRRGEWRDALRALLAGPDADTLATADSRWRDLYDAFNRHYLTLAAQACAGARLAVLQRLDAWPLYPAYVDALPAWPDSGIVNDPALELTGASLRRQQGATTDGEVALGFQPIRLLIAGAEGAPRQAKDLRAGAKAESDEPAAALRERRRTYLQLAADQLQADLNALDRDGDLTLTSLRCALETLDDRLASLRTHRQATAPEEGLYIPSVSVKILDATQPATALAQLSADANRDARAALEEGYPGFQTALDQAVEEDSWAPIGEWLHAHGGAP
ncbi:MAG: hypothetical protein ABJN17_15520 [Alloalcanivorax venustensis]|uniref:imelysin family protein n=1 Tax=Alloalcanivorax venustensis TaxID=172371 RepID=UPI00329976F9